MVDALKVVGELSEAVLADIAEEFEATARHLLAFRQTLPWIGVLLHTQHELLHTEKTTTPSHTFTTDTD